MDVSHHVLPLLGNQETPMRSRIQHALKIAALGAATSTTPALAQNAPDNAIPNADGSRTILRSQQLPEANERHARWCQMHGAVDMTNEGDVTLGPKTFDGIVCQSLGPSKPGFSGAYIPKDQSLRIISPDAEMEKAPSITPKFPRKSLEPESSLVPYSSAVIPTISVYPNNDYTLKRDAMFYPASYAIFHNFTGGPRERVVSSIPLLGCTWRREGVVQEGSPKVWHFIGCIAPSFQTVVATNIEACAGILCARGQGSFVVD
ncbi:hypothetical protein [Cupriavidus necator]|uniref:hypothetical protein n=1 Tax=Cupriavidus necator TaxID=106590 RepID=UPI00277D3F5C|nr:hypothetical protein [Cupriavidus necator]MDQ0141056.1 hypothetical protein [Cupriavidus necator]